MLRSSTLEGIRAGSITLAFRRWKRPTVRAGGCGPRSASMATQPFKARVRRLKELGLTESLEVGYRLSPRGRAYFSALATTHGR